MPWHFHVFYLRPDDFSFEDPDDFSFEDPDDLDSLCDEELFTLDAECPELTEFLTGELTVPEDFDPDLVEKEFPLLSEDCCTTLLLVDVFAG